ncbi:hypothetical protein [Streptomyces sp. NPDC001985]|uniref:hypothetical protein n=1 Tax=Streptomyces sp. NPDC001985 TaxID=3154406 RepID=UPI00331D1593
MSTETEPPGAPAGGSAGIQTTSAWLFALLLKEHRGLMPAKLASLGLYAGQDGLTQPQACRGPGADPRLADVRRGEPVPQRFVDGASLPGSRLWGQGAGLRVREVSVTSRPAAP